MRWRHINSVRSRIASSSANIDDMTAIDDSFSWRSEHAIPSDPRAARVVLDELLRQMESLAWNEHEVFCVHLAVYEAMMNAVVHGNRCDDCKRISVVCELSSEIVRVRIKDEGPGFNPGVVPNPTETLFVERDCGRGLWLMKAFMSEVSYNEVGNEVTLEKRRGDKNSSMRRTAFTL